jgi:hypothetical protein
MRGGGGLGKLESRIANLEAGGNSRFEIRDSGRRRDEDEDETDGEEEEVVGPNEVYGEGFAG